MTGAPSDPDQAAIADHCRRYVDLYRQATLPDGRSKIARQQRSLESEKEARPGDDRHARPPERVVTAEAKLFARLGPNTGRRIFVTGDATTGDGGSGKSEFTCQLAQVAAAAALGAMDGDRPPLVPIRYELKNLRAGTPIFDRLKAECRVPSLDSLDSLAASGSLLVILDGLDELRRDAAESFDEALADVLAKLCRCPVVVAGREASLRNQWKNRLSIRPDDYFRLQPFSGDKVEAFVQGFFGPDNASADAMMVQFRVASPAVQPLLRQPFMLSMACLGIQAGDVRLPAEPAQFFASGLLHLLHRRRSIELPPDARMKLEPKDALDRLGLLAAFACESDFRFRETDRDFPAANVAAGATSATDVLNDLAPHSGILCVQPGGAAAEYSFSNRVVAEYLAGTFIAKCGPAHEPNDAYVSRPPKIEPGSLRFYGRHVWQNGLANVRRWIGAEWGSQEMMPGPLNRAVDWLLAELRARDWDDASQTLLARLLGLVGEFDDASFEARGDTHQIIELTTGLLPPELVSLPGGPDAQLDVSWRELLRPLPWALKRRYTEHLSAEIGKPEIPAYAIARLAEALHAVGAPPPAIDKAAEMLNAEIEDFVAALPDCGRDSFFHLVRLARALSTIGVGTPATSSRAVAILEAKLGEPGLEHVCGQIMEVLTTLRSPFPGDATEPTCGSSQEFGFSVEHLLIRIGSERWFTVGTQEMVDKLARWDAAPLNLIKEVMAALSSKLDGPNLSKVEFQWLAEALAALGASGSSVSDSTLDKLSSNLCRPDLSGYEVGKVAQALVALGAGRPSVVDKAISAMSTKLDEIRLTGLDGLSLAQMLASTGAGRPDVAAALARVGFEFRSRWPEHVIIFGQRSSLEQRLRSLRWHEVAALPRSPAAVPGAVVIWPNGTTPKAADDPTKLETRTGGPPPAEPEFLLARREDLTPGLDPTLCPPIDGDQSTTLDEFIANTAKRLKPAGRGDGPDKNALNALAMLLDLRELIADTFAGNRKPRTTLDKAEWEKAGNRKWAALAKRDCIDLTELHNVLIACQTPRNGMLLGYDTFKRAVNRLRDQLSKRMPAPVRDEYLLLFRDLRISIEPPRRNDSP